jgi:hypothetical protein
MAITKVIKKKKLDMYNLKVCGLICSWFAQKSPSTPLKIIVARKDVRKRKSWPLDAGFKASSGFVTSFLFFQITGMSKHPTKVRPKHIPWIGIKTQKAIHMVSI